MGTDNGERVVDLGQSYDLARSLGILQRGAADPAVRVDPGEFAGGPHGTPGAGAWLAQRIYDASGAERGQVSMRLDQVSPTQVRVRVTGTSGEAVATALDRVPLLLGAADDWTELELLLDALGDRISSTLAQLRRRHPGLRLPATGALFDQLITVTLEQKVTHAQARHSWRNLVRRHGEHAPSSSSLSGPGWLTLPLSAKQLARVPSWEWHQLWVQPPLSAAIQRVAGRAGSIHRLAASTAPDTDDVADLAERLTSISGIGQWTAAEALQRSHGAADLPSVGDYHLAHFVGEALTGQRTDDAGMLELLEPFRPHRQRIIRLLMLSGFRHQRRGARLAPEDHRDR